MGYAQSQADWWYFGVNAGIHFDQNGTPSAVYDGQLNTLEGCATISNNQGELLFYTDGSTVYDANHTIMPNGTGLLGWSSSTHSAIIVPKPGNQNLFYIFTVDATENSGSNGLRYTLVDMTLNGGMGDVVTDSLNVVLIDSTTEKIAAYPHANGYDFWVVGHAIHTDEYLSWKVTSNGVQQTPVVSQIGTYIEYPFQNHSRTRGYLRFHPTGEHIASAILSDTLVEYMDFNRNTGELTNLREIETFTLPYGIEFSASGELMYISGWSWGGNALYQYDVSSGVQSTILASMYTIPRTMFYTAGALQLGLDNRIYFGQVSSQYLGIINDPDVYGPGCNYQDSGLYIADSIGTISRYGLPTFVQSFLLPGIDADGRCYGDSTYFYVDTFALDSVIGWNFGDPASGAANTSTLINPAHVFSDTGIYTLTLIVQVDTNFDTIFNTVQIYPRQTLELGDDTTLCFGDTLTLDATEPYSSYLWSDSTTAPTFDVYRDSVVSVTLLGVCDTLMDTIRVSFDTLPILDLGPDSTFCEPHTKVLDPGLNVGAVYGWNTGDVTKTLSVSQSGVYIFTAANVCGAVSDSVEITIIPVPDSAILPPDTLNCFENAIFLTRPQNDSITWVWSDSSDVEVFEVDTTMTVWLAAFNECGVTVDTFHAVFNGEIKTEMGEDTVICSEDSIRLWGTDSLATYVWNTNEITDTIVTEVGESKNYIVTITLRDCQAVESREVLSSDTACPELDCDLKYGNIFTPNGDGWNDRFRVESECEIFQFSMLIYNRWGQLVHESQNISYGWDGYVNGEPASEGTYYFTVVYKDYVVVNADRFVTRGSFTLIR